MSTVVEKWSPCSCVLLTTVYRHNYRTTPLITHASPRDSHYLLWPHGGAVYQRAGWSCAQWSRHHTLLRHRLVNFWSSYLDREERKLRKASIYVLDRIDIPCVLMKRHHSSPKYYSNFKYTSTTVCAPRCVLAPPIFIKYASDAICVDN